MVYVEENLNFLGMWFVGIIKHWILYAHNRYAVSIILTSHTFLLLHVAICLAVRLVWPKSTQECAYFMLKKAMLKKMWIQNGQPRPLAVDGIKIFDKDDQAAKHYCCLPLLLQAVGRQQ